MHFCVKEEGNFQRKSFCESLVLPTCVVLSPNSGSSWRCLIIISVKCTISGTVPSETTGRERGEADSYA